MKMLHPLIAFLSFFMCSQLSAQSLEVSKEINFSNVFESSYAWPPRVNVLEDFELKSKAFAKNTSGIVIRLEDAKTVLADFGRAGIHAVPIEKTDFIAQANRFAEEQRLDGDNTYGNATGFLANRLFELSGDELKQKGVQEISIYKYYLLIYSSNNDAHLIQVSDLLAPHQSLLEEKGVLPIILHQVPIADDALGEYMKEYNCKYPFMYMYLSEAYTRVFQHHPKEGALTLALIDSNGKNVVRYEIRNGFKAESLAEILEAL